MPAVAADAPRLNPGDGERARLIAAVRGGSVLVTHKCYRSDFAQGWHEHENPSVEFVLAGSGEGTYGGARVESVAGAVEFFRPGVRHRFAAGGRGIRTLHVMFPSSAADAVRDDVVVRRLEPTRALPLALAMLREISGAGADASRALAIESLAHELLGEVCMGSAVSRTAPTWLGLAMEMLRAASPAPLPLGRLAAEVGVERAHLARTFRSHAGVSVGEYHRRVRLAEGARRLARGEEAISRVAFDLGFADQAHFTRHFRRFTGVTPGTYRRLLDS